MMIMRSYLPCLISSNPRLPHFNQIMSIPTYQVSSYLVTYRVSTYLLPSLPYIYLPATFISMHKVCMYLSISFHQVFLRARQTEKTLLHT